jgi:hypothetical protein
MFPAKRDPPFDPENTPNKGRTAKIAAIYHLAEVRANISQAPGGIS